ncbi:MAG: TIGR03557 family F420-dependent LLM class oxidoreductase [Actinobacteria bacterium]|nr:TIGR03557 family F420-dependent LLM class oxidoreductase [Actinomycetota bacterium]
MADTTRPVLELGFWLSSEEHDPKTLVRNAVRAEQVGFRLAGISDHYHPWVPDQGQSPFVWSVLGGIAEATDHLRIGTGVTAPLIRMHPAIVAQAAATAAVMLDGRFFLGVGTGERLNEHIIGGHWPRPDVRRDMLEEAVSIIRQLWDGGAVDHHGAHYTVEQAQLFTLPERPPPIVVAGSSTKSAQLAGRIGDGFFGVMPSSLHVDTFEGAGGAGKPRIAQIHVCWATTEDQARQTAAHWWPNAALKGTAITELAHPKDFAQVLSLARPDDIVETMALGPDAQRHLDLIAAYAAAGFNQILIHQIGPDQEGFLRFYEKELMSVLEEVSPKCA